MNLRRELRATVAENSALAANMARRGRREHPGQVAHAARHARFVPDRANHVVACQHQEMAEEADTERVPFRRLALHNPTGEL